MFSSSAYAGRGRWLIGLALLLAFQSAAHAAAVTVKLTTLAPKGSSYHRSLQRMGEIWRESSQGQVELVIYAGGIQGGEAAMVERMMINQAQAGLLTAIGLAEIEPAVSGLQNMPLVFRSLEELDHVGAQLQPRLEQRMLDRGFVVLAWVDAGWVRFFSRTPVAAVEDLKRLKLFTWAGDAQTSDVMTRAGLKPVALETSDILTGLQTGLIDAVPLPPFFALASQVYRPAPYMLDLDWAPLVGALVISKRSWDRIPEALRPTLRAAARSAGEEIRSSGRAEAAGAVETMQEKWGLTVYRPTAEEQAGWRKAVEAAHPAIRGGIVPAEIFDEVQRLLVEFRARDESGR